jgi:toxin-antitoxin system PIN domain toxin
MSSTVDANILVYASNRNDPVHQQALELIQRLAAGPDLVYLFWPVLLAYLRIVSHPAILPKPLTPREAIAKPEALLLRPHILTPGEVDGFWDLFRRTSRDRRAEMTFISTR